MHLWYLWIDHCISWHTNQYVIRSSRKKNVVFVHGKYNVLNFKLSISYIQAWTCFNTFGVLSPFLWRRQCFRSNAAKAKNLLYAIWKHISSTTFLYNHTMLKHKVKYCVFEYFVDNAHSFTRDFLTFFHILSSFLIHSLFVIFCADK